MSLSFVVVFQMIKMPRRISSYSKIKQGFSFVQCRRGSRIIVYCFAYFLGSCTQWRILLSNRGKLQLLSMTTVISLGILLLLSLSFVSRMSSVDLYATSFPHATNPFYCSQLTQQFVLLTCILMDLLAFILLPSFWRIWHWKQKMYSANVVYTDVFGCS